jgi:hypothetical protein
MIYLRGGMDNLPGYLAAIITWYVSASSVIYIPKTHSFISKHANTGYLRPQTFFWEPGEEDKEKTDCVFHPWWKPKYREIMASK